MSPSHAESHVADREVRAVAPCAAVREPQLIVTRNGFELERVSLKRRITTIGRIPGNDVVLDADGVSRRHLQIINVRGECLVEDLGSRNGTFVNNAWRRVCELRHGDEIVVAKFRLRFELADLPADEPAQDLNVLLRGWGMASAEVLSARRLHAAYRQRQAARCPRCGAPAAP